MTLFLEVTIAILAFTGQVVCFWAIWKILDHIFHPHLERLKKPISVEEVVEKPKPAKKPRKPRAKKTDPKILKFPKEDSVIFTEVINEEPDYLLTPVDDIEIEDYTKPLRKKSRG